MIVEYKSFTTGNTLQFNLLNGFSLKKSTQQYLNSDALIDFSENLQDALWTPTQTDLPVKWQEIKVYDGATLVFSGFLDTVTLPKFETGYEQLHIGLSLYNPYVLACNRTISAQLEGNLVTEITKLVAPLIVDGYTINTNTIPSTKTVNRVFIERTIESVLNQFSKEYNFIWYINQQKEIFFIDADGALAQTPQLVVNTLDDACFSVQPTVQSVDYANVISIKNARVIEFYRRDDNKLQGGQLVQLEYPFSISETQLKRDELGNASSTTGFGVVDQAVGGILLSTVYWNKTTEQVEFIDCAYSDDVNANDYSVLLVADPFDKTIITGFIINDTNTYSEIRITSDVALVPTFKTIEIPDEITKMVGIVSDSGRVQKIIDVRTRIFTETELVQFATNNIRQNISGTSQVTLESDYDLGLGLTNKIQINLPDILVDGDFVITEIEYKRRMEEEKYFYSCRNTNFTENFLDIYRRQELEPTQEEFDNQGFSVLVTDEEIIEKPLVKTDGVLMNEIT